MIYIGHSAVVSVGNASIDVSKVSFSEFTEANAPAGSMPAASEVECSICLSAADAAKFWQMMREATGTYIVCPRCGIGRRYTNQRAALRAWTRLRSHVCPRGSR